MNFRIYPIVILIMSAMLSALEQPQPVAGRAARPLPPTPGGLATSAGRPLPKTPVRSHYQLLQKLLLLSQRQGSWSAQTTYQAGTSSCAWTSILLVSADDKEFKVPLEIAQQSELIKAFTRSELKRVELMGLWIFSLHSWQKLRN